MLHHLSNDDANLPYIQHIKNYIIRINFIFMPKFLYLCPYNFIH